METFRVRRDADPAVRKQEAWRFLLAAGPYWAYLLLRELRWPSSYERSESLLERVVWTFFESVFFALALQCVSWFGPKTYEIAIDEHQITVIYGRFKRSVRRDQARTVSETQGGIFSSPGLTISKYGRFGTRMLGSVYVPKTLPQYEHIKNMVESWKASEPT
jgi:hypothetical protein